MTNSSNATTDKQQSDTPEKGQTADSIDKDDPHKVEKLSKLGHAGEDAAEGTE